MARNRLIDDVDRRLLRTSIALGAVCLVTFLALRLMLLLLDGASPIDIWLANHIRQPHPSQGLQIIHRLAAASGSVKGATALILVVAAWAWLRRRDVRPGVLLIAAFVVTKASVEVLKALLGVGVRVTPIPATGEMQDRAFLSSHVAVAVAVFAMLAVVIWLLGRRDLLFPAVAIAILLVIAVALSVMATEKHYLVDVLCGVAVGGFCVAILAPVGDLMWKRIPAPISPASSRELASGTQVVSR